MKTRVEKFSVHQNAKVFSVLMALSSLVFVVPFTLVMSFAGPKGAGFPVFMVVAFPVLYLVMGYVTVAVGCWLYNVMVKYTGGLEFEFRDVEA